MINKEHPQVEFGKTGILLVNLGTPDSTNWFDVRRYLKEFLSDRRVIEVNPIIWQIILNLFILTLRPSKSARAYKKIWFKETNESPLLFYTRSQAEKLNKNIGNGNVRQKVLFCQKFLNIFDNTVFRTFRNSIFKRPHHAWAESYFIELFSTLSLNGK